MSPARLLLVEAYKPLQRALKRGLEAAGFAVDVGATRGEADDLARSSDYDVIILDCPEPGASQMVAGTGRDSGGVSLLTQWRADKIKTRVLLVAPRDSKLDTVGAFNLGADDCLAKPIEMEELLVRVRALARPRVSTNGVAKSAGAPEAVMRIHDLEINLATHTVRRAGQVIHLTPREFELLRFLAMQRGKVATRTMIWQHLYDDCDHNTSNVIDVYIRYLRTKIDNGFDRKLILTSWGKGYRVSTDDGSPEHSGANVDWPNASM